MSLYESLVSANSTNSMNPTNSIGPPGACPELAEGFALSLSKGLPPPAPIYYPYKLNALYKLYELNEL